MDKKGNCEIKKNDFVVKILGIFSNWASEGIQDGWNNIHPSCILPEHRTGPASCCVGTPGAFCNKTNKSINTFFFIPLIIFSQKKVKIIYSPPPTPSWRGGGLIWKIYTPVPDY